MNATVVIKPKELTKLLAPIAANDNVPQPELATAGSLWAGYYPLPDPRHGGHPAFLIALLALPFLFAIALWRRAQTAVNVYFVANLILLAAVFPIISGMTGLDTHEYRGIIQRVFALTVFVPIGVAAFVLGRRIKALPE